MGQEWDRCTWSFCFYTDRNLSARDGRLALSQSLAQLEHFAAAQRQQKTRPCGTEVSDRREALAVKIEWAAQ